MRRRPWPQFVLVLCLALSSTTSAFPAPAHGASASRLNFVVILADDLGYSDLGCYGGEIDTPHLDRLAAAGLRYTQFYNTARCWPTRAALLTGYYPQQVNRDALPGRNRGNRPPWAKLLPERLRNLGYRNYHSGKWHMDGQVLAGGFDRSYCLNDHDRYFHPQDHQEDDKPLTPISLGSDYYATTAIADHALRCLREHARDTPQQPFFQFIAFTAPHFPLQAIPVDIATYREAYDKGWDEIRQVRWQRIQRELHFPGDLSPREANIGPPYSFPEALRQLGAGEVNRELPWSTLTPLQKAFQTEKMAIHAAMVNRLDHQIGRLVDVLRAMCLLDNTVIFFLSDNGASAEIMIRGDGHDPAAVAGSSASFLCLGPGWSRAANTPFRRHKTWVHEGGIASPLIVHWPVGIHDQGALRTTVSHVIDIAPTILELARHSVGLSPLTDADANVPPPPGRNLAPSFAPAPPEPSAAPRTLWWLHEGNRAFRLQDWKLVAARDQPWELYDLHQDRAETTDLAAQQPDRVTSLAHQWQSMCDEFERWVAAGDR